MSIKEIIEEVLDRKVSDIKVVDSGWLVLCDDGNLFMFTHIIRMTENAV